MCYKHELYNLKHVKTQITTFNKVCIHLGLYNPTQYWARIQMIEFEIVKNLSYDVTSKV